jgi:16S rRNA (uracil1498-N3)-methyltransferase
VAHRFHAPAAARRAGVVELPPDEADHLRRVLRLGVDDAIRIFDGAGHEFEGRVVSLDDGVVRVEVGAAVEPAREMRTRVTVAQSALKGDKMDGVIRDAVMLGVFAIQPLTSARSDVPASVVQRRLERWTRIALASAKQCGRARIPQIGRPRAFEEWMVPSPGPRCLMLVEPRAGRDVPHLREVTAAAPDEAAVVVGPEGGWTSDEIAHASASGAQLVTLGARTLRADAVALVVLSMLLFAWD